MSRGKELIKNTAILTVGKLCTQFVSFLLLPLYTSLLHPDEYGVFDLFSTYIALLLPLFSWQLDQGLFRFMLDIRDDKEAIKPLFSSLCIANCLQSFAACVIFFLINRFRPSEYLIYLLISVILNIFSGLFMQFARGLGKMMQYSISSFLTASGTVFLNVLFIAILKLGAHGMFLALLGGILLNCVYLFFALQVWQYFSFKCFTLKTVKEVCQYTLPLVPNQISGWVLSASNRTIITPCLGLAANGIFSVASKFSNLIGTVYGFFNVSWIESVSVHYHDEDRDLFISSMIQKALELFIAICFGVIAVMPFAFPIMVDVQYADAYYQIPTLILSVIFQIMVGLYSAIYIALKKSSTIARTTLVGALINVAVHIILVRFIGLYAASISTLVSYATVAIYRCIDVSKYVHLTFPKNFALKYIVAGAVVTLSYYVNNPVLNAVTLLATIVFAMATNRDLIIAVFSEIRMLIKQH